MIKIVNFMGGLGNQMFAYAFYHSLKRKNKFSIVVIDSSFSAEQHNGYEIQKIFTRVDNESYKFTKRSYFKGFKKLLFNQLEQTKVGFFDSFINNKHPFLIYKGFWQSERYFQSYEADIKQLFTFNYALASINTKKALIDIQNKNSVSIHIRKGDYDGNTELSNICTIDYYKKSIDFILSNVNNPVFFVFSDDLTWVKINFTDFAYTLIDWNKRENSWQDMLLMSNCKHNIIANSSFSWWGAWLNSNPNKLVIAPQKWFNTLQDNDIVPLSWIRL